MPPICENIVVREIGSYLPQQVKYFYQAPETVFEIGTSPFKMTFDPYCEPASYSIECESTVMSALDCQDIMIDGTQEVNAIADTTAGFPAFDDATGQYEFKEVIDNKAIYLEGTYTFKVHALKADGTEYSSDPAEFQLTLEDLCASPVSIQYSGATPIPD